MKKTISITISGLIFHIEEDGFQALRTYLDEVKKYFSGYDDGSEIYSDIENRIAEIFTGKLSASKAVITIEDVDNLMASLGTVSDFKAAEEADNETTQQPKPEAEPAPLPRPKRLERDLRNKMLGGVCAGFAYYLGIDTIWIRLLTLALFLGLIAIPGIGALPGFVFIAYIVFWIAIPGTYAVEESEMPAKKLMRHPKDRVFAGVAGGIASYFNVDVTLIRVLFLVTTLLFGTGLLLYICLWIVMPQARTITDMMFMSGEAVTISSIEQRLKQQQQGGYRQQPIGARVADGFSQVGRNIVQLFVTLIAVFAGIITGFVSLVMLFALAVVGGVLFKLINPDSALASHVQLGDLHPSFITQEVSNLTLFSGFGVSIIPVVFLLLVSISLIARQWMIKMPTAITLLSVWVVSMAIFAYSGLPLVGQFQKEAEQERVVMLPMPQTGNLTLTLHDIEGESRVIPSKVELTVLGYNGDSLKLVQHISAHGKTYDSAVANTRSAEYNILQVDSLLSFDSHLKLKEGGRYRIQKGLMKLYMPKDKPFRFDPKVYDILLNTLTPAGYYYSDLKNNSFMFTDKGLTCITCAEKTDGTSAPSENDNDDWSEEE